MTTAWLFPGQGAVEPRMGLALAGCCEPAAALLELASQSVGTDVCKLLARGGAQLERSEILQPVLTAVSLGAAIALRARGAAPAMVAGHSLGELAAWSASGVLDAQAAINLASARGRFMAQCARETRGGMVALVGIDDASVEQALARGRRHGSIFVAARNAPDEWVLAGDEPALRAVESTTPSVRLRVEGPWHTLWMEGAAGRLRQAAAALKPSPMTVPLVTGTTGQLIAESSGFANITADLLVRPLQWVEVMATLRAHAVTAIVTCGPGKVLRSLIRRNLGAGVHVFSTDHPAELQLACKGEPA